MNYKQEITNALENDNEYQKWHTMDISTRLDDYDSIRVQILIRKRNIQLTIIHKCGEKWSFTSLKHGCAPHIHDRHVLLTCLFELLPYEGIMQIVARVPSLIEDYLDELTGLTCKSEIFTTIHGERFLIYRFKGKSTIIPILDDPIYIPESIYRECYDWYGDAHMLIPITDTPPMSMSGWRGVSWSRDIVIC